MAKLTVSFHGNPLEIHHCHEGVLTIGRDPDNTIRIDSPAVAGKQIIIDLEHPSGPQLFCEAGTQPVKVNGHVVDQHSLRDGDHIQLGEHTLLFHDDGPADTHAPKPPPEATLQFLNGKNIGRIVPLKRALTRLGKAGDSIAVVARRKQGFYLSCLEQGEAICLNGEPLGDRTVALRPGDVIEINGNRLLFDVI
ncbi:hypothetical protein MIN45_P0537 [Methylomarinovum tepidoasis]|uniref:FHA domain-containing protein n=1 Tax=Methylomarinovum tepidoasis TaxID=2840183 RepID=A0AAU9CVM0_9GAMM|nr:FHA domain-containing protein [Methylomarinovum sp. IN45]BCX88169.1 hypothetical protein MIN45_P0537 [Methylomarinovum sp. IN45]